MQKSWFKGYILRASFTCFMPLLRREAMEMLVVVANLEEKHGWCYMVLGL